MRTPVRWTLFIVGWVFLATGWAMGERGLLGIAVGIFLTLVATGLDRSAVK